MQLTGDHDPSQGGVLLVNHAKTTRGGRLTPSEASETKGRGEGSRPVKLSHVVDLLDHRLLLGVGLNSLLALHHGDHALLGGREVKGWEEG